MQSVTCVNEFMLVLLLQRYVENSNVGSCLNELLCLEHCEVRSRLKMHAADALFTALDNVSEMVEITNADNEIEVRMKSMESNQ